MGLRAASVETFLKASMHLQSLEVGDYLKAFETIHAARFGFEDVQRFMFKPQINVILNLLAVHYCMAILGIRVFHPLPSSFIFYLFYCLTNGIMPFKI